MSTETIPGKYKFYYGVVAPDDDKDPKKIGNVKIYCPAQHGSNFTKDDLVYCTWLTDDPYKFKRPPTPGSIVCIMRPEGSPTGIIIGEVNDEFKTDFGGNGGGGN